MAPAPWRQAQNRWGPLPCQVGPLSHPLSHRPRCRQPRCPLALLSLRPWKPAPLCPPGLLPSTLAISLKYVSGSEVLFSLCVFPRMTSAALLGGDCDASVSTATWVTHGPSDALCATGKLTVSPQLSKSWPRAWHSVPLSLHHPFALLVSAEFPSYPWPGPAPSSLSAASGLSPPLVPHMVDVVMVLKWRLLACLPSAPFDGPE